MNSKVPVKETGARNLATFLMVAALASNSQINLPANADAQSVSRSASSTSTTTVPANANGNSSGSPSAGATVNASTSSDDTVSDKKQTKEERKEAKAQEKLLGKSKTDEDVATADAHSAPCISWVDPLVKPKICLLCIHGLGLYSGSYEDIGKWFAKRGIATYAIDVRGFGSWMKTKKDEDVNFPACLTDIQTTLKSIRAANPGLPVYILGESMGGAISLRAAALYPDLIDGLISSVPAGERFKQKRTDLKVALEFLTGPNKQHNMGKAVVAQATENDKLRKDWEDDPMDRMEFSAKQLIQFQKFMNENHDAAKLIQKMPVLLVEGSKDKLVKPEGNWEIFNEINSEDKDFLSVPSEHLIFEEQQDHTQKFDERVSYLVLTWFRTHLPPNYKWAEPLSVPDHTGATLKLTQGNYVGAAKDLDAAILADPVDGRAYFMRGLAESKLNQPLKARRDFSKAMALGHGTDAAKHANDQLLALVSAPKTGGIGLAANTVPVILDKDVLKQLDVVNQPAILAFYAPWAEQCKDIDKTAGQSTTIAHNVKFVKVDIDDVRFTSLVKACSVGPIPTFVFVRKDGTVGSTSIGMNNFPSFAKGLGAIPTAHPAGN